MALTAGSRIGVYEVTAPIGEGGMGQVYRATDTTLGRQVAIKILPDAFAADPERLARFEREAKTLASLNHPHIAAIYGFERSGGMHALVMELVEGEDLSQRIARGPIRFAEALPIARQIAEALEAAHEQSIIHRDLKPANIKVRDDGTVKVLDFGLAKAMDVGAAGSAGAFSMSPTITTPAMMTGMGTILGTAAYMSPEQAKGRIVDKRSDVWAFGCVLFEMLTGRRAFEGEDVTDTIAAVVRGEPEWRALPADVPEQIRLLLRRCLEKERKARISDIGVARFLMTETLPASATIDKADARSVAAPQSFWARAIPVAAAALVAGVIVGAAAWMLRPPAPPSPVTRFTIMLGDGQQFTALNGQSVGLSPDGTRLAYVANLQLYLRLLSEPDAKLLPGTLERTTPQSPVFSPDGQSIAFFSTQDGSIKKIAASGGAVVTICPADTPFRGMTWSPAGIVFGQGSKGIMRVSADGGEPAVLVGVKTGELASTPQVLPGGEWVLFTVATTAGWDKAQIVVQALTTSERKTLIPGGSDARYLPSGHIVYALGGVLFAVPFDLRHLAVIGGPVPVVEGVKRAASALYSTAHLSVSSTGSLAFVPGPIATSSGQFDLALIDRTGAMQPLKLPPASYEHPRLSPNGKQIAVGTDDGKDAAVSIYDLSGAGSVRRLTLTGRNRLPVWSADSERIAFQTDREGDLGIFWQRADGTTPAARLTTPDKDTAHLPESWSPDGKTLLFSIARGSIYSLASLSLPDKKVTLLGGIQSISPPSATFSPDGRWVAYSLAVTGRRTLAGSLFVQPFPMTGATYPISKDLGFHPTWAPDGKELFYTTGPNQYVSVSVTTQPTFTFKTPVAVLMRHVEVGPGFERNNDIMPDGKRFLGVVAAGQNVPSGAAPTAQIQVVLNWFEELKARVPAR